MKNSGIDFHLCYDEFGLKDDAPDIAFNQGRRYERSEIMKWFKDKGMVHAERAMNSYLNRLDILNEKDL